MTIVQLRNLNFLAKSEFGVLACNLSYYPKAAASSRNSSNNSATQHSARFAGKTPLLGRNTVVKVQSMNHKNKNLRVKEAPWQISFQGREGLLRLIADGNYRYCIEIAIHARFCHA